MNFSKLREYSLLNFVGMPHNLWLEGTRQRHWRTSESRSRASDLGPMQQPMLPDHLLQTVGTYLGPGLLSTFRNLNAHHRNVLWVANKRFEISKFKFKIQRARTSELQGSVSAVSKPNFASKYSLESSRRDLHNALLCTVL